MGDRPSFPPDLAPGPNPIAFATLVYDTSLTPDERFLVICEGNAASAFDTATRARVDTLLLDTSCTAVDACDDGSILVASAHDSVVRRLTIGGSGELADTGESLAVEKPNDVVCSPGAASGIVVTRATSEEIVSFTFPGLAVQDVRPLAGRGAVSVAIHPAGHRVFARGRAVDEDRNPISVVKAFDFDASTATLSAESLFTIPALPAATRFGVEQLALHPDGTKLYVPQAGILGVYDSGSGELLTEIAGTGPGGICFARAP